MNDLMRFFGQVAAPPSFDRIQISIASPERIRSWSFGEIRSRKRSTTARSSQSGKACFAPAFSVRSRTTSACAASTSA